MEIKRKPYQGVWNIIRFNPQFYSLALLTIVVIIATLPFSTETVYNYLCASILFLSLLILISLAASYYIYDVSKLYTLSWINHFYRDNQTVINIHAGFDEITPILKQKFKNSDIRVMDFYNPAKHTEPSIERARKAYPAVNGAQQVNTTNLPIEDNSADYIFVFLAAHEIRDNNERIMFFKELERVIKPSGKIFITEHLRDIPNFIAYTIGFFHFYPKSSWRRTFEKSGLHLEKEIKNTIWLSTFILQKDGNTL